MCMWVIFDQQQLLLSPKGGGQAARQEFWRVTEVGSSQEDSKDGEKVINENTWNKISIACLIHKKLIFYIYTYPQDPLNRQLSGLLPLSLKLTSKLAKWKWMVGRWCTLYFLGRNPFFHGLCYCLFLGSNPPAVSIKTPPFGSISWRLSHAPCWGPYSLSRPILTGDHLPLRRAVSREKTWGWWLVPWGGMDRKFVRETRVFLIWFDGV